MGIGVVNHYRGAAARRLLDGNASAVRLYDAFAQAQAQPEALPGIAPLARRVVVATVE